MKRQPRKHLTASDFYKYLKCPNWVYWDVFGDPKDKGDVPEMMKKLREDGLLHEKEVVAKLGDFEEAPLEGTPEEQSEATLKLMKKGAPLIYQGTLLDGDWVGRPDLLAKIEAPSKFGDWAYEAIDIKNAWSLHDAHKYQLTFYALLLEKVQGFRPDVGTIINAENRKLTFVIDEVYADFFEILNRILAIRAGEKPAPFFMSACKDSPWYALCKKEAEEKDDISLIYKIYKKEYQKLHDGGYVSLTQLAATTFDDLLADVRGISEARLERLRLQAQSLHEKKIIRVGDAGLGEETSEIFFDIEGDPLLGIEYLFGLLIRGDGKTVYKAFIAEKPEDEGKAWLAFCDFMETVAGTTIYHYGWYERDVIRRLSAKHGISRKAAEALDEAYMIDLLKVIPRTVIFPLYFYSLKDICKHLGFSWRAADASGANSVLWFQEWLEKGDRKMLQKIIDYNEDDVRATLFLKDWLAKGA